MLARQWSCGCYIIISKTRDYGGGGGRRPWRSLRRGRSLAPLARCVGGAAIARGMAVNLRPSYSKVITEAALSLVTDTVKGSFLGSEVPEKSEAELSLDSAWKALGRGEIAAAIEVCSAPEDTARHDASGLLAMAVPPCSPPCSPLCSPLRRCAVRCSPRTGTTTSSSSRAHTPTRAPESGSGRWRTTRLT